MYHCNNWRFLTNIFSYNIRRFWLKTNKRICQITHFRSFFLTHTQVLLHAYMPACSVVYIDL